MISVSTHVLDTNSGTPASGIEVKIESVVDGSWTLITGGVTDGDGRCAELASGLAAGHYRLRFNTGDYGEGFFPEITVTCNLKEDRHYHIPVLLSTFGFTTYRGS
jgi:5-hydroxyisourate hydrolase